MLAAFRLAAHRPNNDICRAPEPCYHTAPATGPVDEERRMIRPHKTMLAGVAALTTRANRQLKGYALIAD